MLRTPVLGKFSACIVLAVILQACSSAGGTDSASNNVSSGATLSSVPSAPARTDTVTASAQANDNSKSTATTPTANPGSNPVNPNPSGTPPTVNPTPPPAPANPLRTRRIRLLCLGDSMTAGSENNDGSFRSYRGRLYQLLTSAGIDVDFIGSSQMTPAIGGDADHDGYGGAFIGPGGNVNNLWDRLPTVLASNVDPDIIVMAFGWNSVYNEPSEAAGKYQAIVNRVSTLKPSANLVLATLSPQRGESEQQSNLGVPSYQQFNDTARILANHSSTDKLFLADYAAAPFELTGYWDVIHWLQPNADLAARIIFDSLMAGPLKP
jgi:lysophospholipase L1-like esterase